MNAPPADEDRRFGAFHPLFWVTLIVVTVADLGSKAWAWSFVEENGDGIPGHKVYDVVKPWFRLVQAENPGTVWGLFQGYTEVLIGIRIVMVLAILFLALKTWRSELLKLFGFGLVLAGAIGNLYDNLFRETRAVRDFLDFHIPLPWREDLYHYPTFNIADSSILCGAILLFIAFGREGPKEEEAASVAAGVEDPR